MNKSIIPETWHCTNNEGNAFLNTLAVKYVTKDITLENVDEIIKLYSTEIYDFLYSELGQECNAFDKETLIPIIDFLIEITKGFNIEEEDIICRFQEIVYKY